MADSLGAPAASFLAAPGEMAGLIRSRDWSATSLGAAEGWPASLKAMVRMALTTRHPIFIFWGAGHVCLYNDAYSASLGPEKHPAILGMRAVDAWPEIWPAIGPQIEMVMRGEGATWHENQLLPIHRHGALQDAYWTYSYGPIDDADSPDGVGGVLVVCTETTQQVLTERRLGAERKQLAQLFEQAPTFMAMLRGPDHVIELANPGYMQLVGHRPVIGRSVAEALPEVEEQGYLRLLDDVYASGKAFSASGSKVALQAVPGGPVQEHYVDFVYQPIADAAGVVTGIFVQGADVSERRAAEQALRDADRRKDEFLATLAHELRNPLAPIRNAASLLQHRGLAAERVAWCGELIERQIGVMALLLDDLLEVSRINHGKLELHKVWFSVASVVAAAVETAQPLIDLKRHVLVVREPAEPIELHADPLRLSQVLTNLLTNAAKYTDPDGHIALDVRLGAGAVSIEVVDDGAGITAELMPSLFRLFEQGKDTLDRAEGGLGIGLAFSKGLVDLHGGRIEAFSAGAGRGSTFRVTLPIEAGAPLARRSTELRSRDDLSRDLSRDVSRDVSGDVSGDLSGDLSGDVFGDVSSHAADDASRRERLKVFAAGTSTTAARAAPGPAVTDSAAPSAIVDAGCVLIADDNFDAASALGMVLEMEGYDVHLARDGLEALETANRVRPLAALLDIGMPGLDGYGLAEALRSQAWSARMVLIAMTGWGQSHDKQRALAAGFDLHLTKPVAPDTVIEVLADRLAANG